MDINQFLEEIEKQPPRTRTGGDINEKHYKNAIQRVTNSSFREAIETKILHHAYKLLPFSRKPKSLSAMIFKNAIYYVEYYPEIELTKKIQGEYIEEMSKKIIETNTILYNNFMRIFNEDKEIINREILNDKPFNGYNAQYLQKFKIIDKQIELGKISHENITWFNTEKNILTYEVADYKYISDMIKEKISRVYYVEMRGIKKIKK